MKMTHNQLAVITQVTPAVAQEFDTNSDLNHLESLLNMDGGNLLLYERFMTIGGGLYAGLVLSHLFRRELQRVRNPQGDIHEIPWTVMTRKEWMAETRMTSARLRTAFVELRNRHFIDIELPKGYPDVVIHSRLRLADLAEAIHACQQNQC